MIFIFRNRTIFWDIPKWNRGQTKWDGGSKIRVIIENPLKIMINNNHTVMLRHFGQWINLEAAAGNKL